MHRCLKAVLFMAVAGALGGCAAHDSAPAVLPAAAPVAAQVATGPACMKPTPTTAKGFAAMFAAVPTSQWGAADVSISVPLDNGRSVWLFGDTFSTGRFVHSTAITEDRGCLHVSRRGAQLLPNDDAKHIYWVESARIVPGGLAVKARAVTLTGTCAWCFKDAGYSRTALVTVSAAGDATFRQWTAKTAAPASDPGPMYSYGPHHFGYARHAHSEFRLASGKQLYTTCQNWDDGKLHGFADYRPTFTER